MSYKHSIDLDHAAILLSVVSLLFRLEWRIKSGVVSIRQRQHGNDSYEAAQFEWGERYSTVPTASLHTDFTTHASSSGQQSRVDGGT